MENKTGLTEWFDLPATDVFDAMAFYETLLDWTFVQMKGKPETDYVMIQAKGKLIGGLRRSPSMPPEVQGTFAPVLYFTVDKLKAKVIKAKELGAVLVGEIVDLGDGRGFYQWMRDREKNLVALWASAL